jgi:hypothetical protein
MAKKRIKKTTKSSHGDETTIEETVEDTVPVVEKAKEEDAPAPPKPPANSSSGMGFCDVDEDWR